ncbi:MAG TPA: heparinase II/III family protein, partial [Acidimicrobiales bacterium]|nr:heparinase II/III family protein [Acidimicrobiales bacterium]
DFIAANPPRYGVNWACTMDVAIRVANWLLAFDILHSYGVELDVAFVTVLAGSVADHASFITSNLEWHPVFRSNHYLADICGLAFAAAYLRDHRGGRRPEKAERWLAMASRELAAETAAQFGPDGGNKEASICYHRLSTEMVIYTTALISTCGASSEWTKGQLGTIERALGFTAWAMKDSGQVPQIGDNDSGRFFMLAPAPTPVSVPEARTRWANLVDYTELEDNEQYWAQDSLDHAHLLAAGGALISSGRRIPLSAPLAAELALWSGTGDVPGALAEIARSRWRGSSMPVVGTTTPPPGLTITPPYDPDLARLQDAGTHDVVRWRVKPGGASLADNLEAAAFPDFGLYILRSPRLYLAFRCGPVGQSGAGGHSHNDQLGLEIEIDGCPWARDPGSYLYTPLPAARNAYRSARAHFVPRQGTEEPGDLEAGLFLLPERAHARCLRFTPGGITGVHYGYGLPTVREVHVTHAFIDVDDTIPKIEETAGPVLVGRATLESPGQLAAFAAAALAFSPSYGVLESPHD